MSENHQVSWKCHACAQAIADNDGYLTIHMEDVKRAYQARDARNTVEILRCNELLGQSDRVEWGVYHRACDPDPDSDDYTIDIRKARTTTELLEWTVHLYESKTWTPFTNWADLMGAHTKGCKA